VKPDAQGRCGDEVCGVVVVVDRSGEGEKWKGVTDVFYFYFYAFNWGGVVLGKDLGELNEESRG
jgi:hypothetical protein